MAKYTIRLASGMDFYETDNALAACRMWIKAASKTEARIICESIRDRKFLYDIASIETGYLLPICKKYGYEVKGVAGLVHDIIRAVTETKEEAVAEMVDTAEEN